VTVHKRSPQKNKNWLSRRQWQTTTDVLVLYKQNGRRLDDCKWSADDVMSTKSSLFVFPDCTGCHFNWNKKLVMSFY